MGNFIRMKKIIVLLSFLLAITVVLFGSTFVLSARAETSFITLYLNGGTIEGVELTENGMFELEFNEEESVLPSPTKSGYEFLGWTKSELAEDDEYVTVISGESAIDITTLYAKYELKSPEIVLQPTDYSGIYGEGGHILSFKVEHENDFELSIQWYKDGRAIENATEEELKITEVNQTGFYYAIASVTVDGEQMNVKSRNAVVSIQKAKFTTVPELILEGVYSPEKTLSDYHLNGYFKWVDGGIIPTPNVRKYPAIFNIDSDNYFDFHCMVTLIISKGEQKIFAEDFSKEYDGMPASITATASGGSLLRYSDNNSLTNVGREYVTVTAPETDLYFEKSVTVILEIIPQTIEIEWTNLSFTYNEEIQVPTAKAIDREGFDVELNVSGLGVDAGEYYATAEALSSNYHISNSTVEYTIEKADYNSDLILFEDKSVVFDGQRHSLEVENLPVWISVNYDATPSEVGVHTITASFVVNSKNYNPIEDKTATLTILQSYFFGEWYEIYCPEGVSPDVTLSLELIDELDGLYNNHRGKLKFILGFRILSSDKTVYRRPMTITFNFENVGIDNVVLSVDKNSNEQVIAYSYENGKVKINVDGAENNIVFAERNQGTAWIIIFVVGICIAVSAGLYLIMNKKSRPQKTQEESSDETRSD